MKILIVDSGIHRAELPYKYKMFENISETTILTRPDAAKLCFGLKQLNVNWIWEPYKLFGKAKSLPFYFYFAILAYSNKYDYIYVNTTPEYNFNKISTLFMQIAFAFYCFIQNKRIILHVRNLEAYKKGQSSTIIERLSKSIFNCAVKKISNFTVDSKTMLVNMRRMNLLKGKNHAILGVKFSDNSINKNIVFNSNKLVIGLLGKIYPYRRDYSIVQKILNELSADNRDTMEINILGEVNGKEAEKIMDNLSKSVKVNWSSGYLDFKSFEELGNRCDVLFAPLKYELGYGQTKETGAFGDSIYFGKKVIIPRFSCRSVEYNEISLYYSNFYDLIMLFKSLLIKNKKEEILRINHNTLKAFSSKNVAESIKRDFHLC